MKKIFALFMALLSSTNMLKASGSFNPREASEGAVRTKISKLQTKIRSGKSSHQEEDSINTRIHSLNELLDSRHSQNSEGAEIAIQDYYKAKLSPFNLNEKDELLLNGKPLLKRDEVEGWVAPISLDLDRKLLTLSGWSAIRNVGSAKEIVAFYKGRSLGLIPIERSSGDIENQYQDTSGKFAKSRFFGALDLKNVDLQDFDSSQLKFVGLDLENSYNILNRVPAEQLVEQKNIIGWVDSSKIDWETNTLNLSGWSALKGESSAEGVTAFYKGKALGTLEVNKSSHDVAAALKETSGDFSHCRFSGAVNIAGIDIEEFDPTQFEFLSFDNHNGFNVLNSVPVDEFLNTYRMNLADEVWFNGKSLTRRAEVEGWVAPISIEPNKKILSISGWSAIRNRGAAKNVVAFYKGRALGIVPISKPSVDIENQYQDTSGKFANSRFFGAFDLSNIDLKNFDSNALKFIGLDEETGFNILNKLPSEPLIEKNEIIGNADEILLNKANRTLTIKGWSAVTREASAQGVGVFYNGKSLGTMMVDQNSLDVVAALKETPGDFSHCRFSGIFTVPENEVETFDPTKLEVLGFDNSNGFKALFVAEMKQGVDEDYAPPVPPRDDANIDDANIKDTPPPLPSLLKRTLAELIESKLEAQKKSEEHIEELEDLVAHMSTNIRKAKTSLSVFNRKIQDLNKQIQAKQALFDGLPGKPVTKKVPGSEGLKLYNEIEALKVQKEDTKRKMTDTEIKIKGLSQAIDKNRKNILNEPNNLKMTLANIDKEIEKTELMIQREETGNKSIVQTTEKKRPVVFKKTTPTAEGIGNLLKDIRKRKEAVDAQLEKVETEVSKPAKQSIIDKINSTRTALEVAKAKLKAAEASPEGWADEEADVVRQIQHTLSQYELEFERLDAAELNASISEAEQTLKQAQAEGNQEKIGEAEGAVKTLQTKRILIKLEKETRVEILRAQESLEFSLMERNRLETKKYTAQQLKERLDVKEKEANQMNIEKRTSKVSELKNDLAQILKGNIPAPKQIQEQPQSGKAEEKTETKNTGLSSEDKLQKIREATFGTEDKEDEENEEEN